MCSTATGYDLLASQFSPEGRIYQIEYAKKAVRKSGTIIGLRGKDCVVLAAEKLHSPNFMNRTPLTGFSQLMETLEWPWQDSFQMASTF
ncbi:hypothetical protein CEXT_467841 [Caerostris extrusa]|uniref:Proteasome alpha-type subunits domain-containing protein n=1 Tax=Caerostris extrusa TaxID=172846 RepID=A0AAV4MSN2_CAEEX|nr:hypothetical protein CEXT_467841 [Caerostris extrusa]